MPLIQSDSQEAFEKNVAEMIKAGHPKDEALAAAYEIQRKNKSNGSEPLVLMRDRVSIGNKRFGKNRP